MKYTQVPITTFQELQLNAGVMLSDFNPTTPTVDRSKIVAATSGGVTLTATPTFSDFGEDIDNVPKNTKELKRIDMWEVKMSGTAVAVSPEFAQRLVAAADLDSSTGKIQPRTILDVDDDFADLWWVGDYSDVNTGDDAGFIAIKVIDALSTGGFQLKSGDKAKGQFTFEFTGHYSIANVDLVPFEMYVMGGEEDTTLLQTLTIGSLELVPPFSPEITNYTAATTNATDAVTATAKTSGATVAIKNGNTSVTSGNNATWSTGANALTVTVTKSPDSKMYTVVVVKS